MNYIMTISFLKDTNIYVSLLLNIMIMKYSNIPGSGIKSVSMDATR